MPRRILLPPCRRPARRGRRRDRPMGGDRTGQPERHHRRRCDRRSCPRGPVPRQGHARRRRRRHRRLGRSHTATRRGRRPRRTPMAGVRPSRGVDCGGAAGRVGRQGRSGRRPRRWPRRRLRVRPRQPTRSAPRSIRPRDVARTRWTRRPRLRRRPPRMRSGHARPRAGPIPGTSGRPGTRSRGSTPPGARAHAAQGRHRRSTDVGGRGSWHARRGRPRRRRRDRLGTRPRWAALARSSQRMIPAAAGESCSRRVYRVRRTAFDTLAAGSDTSMHSPSR